MTDQSTADERRHCPVCDAPLTAVVVDGTGPAVGRPCGHRFPLDALGE